MANTRSDLMANLFSNPVVLNEPRVARGSVRCSIVTTLMSGIEVNDHYFPQRRFNVLDRIIDVTMMSSNDVGGGMGVTLTMDLGLYDSGDWSVADQTEKDVDIWVDGQDFASVLAGPPISVLGRGSTDVRPLTFARAVWEDAGDTVAPTDPSTYDAAWKIITSGTLSGGTIKTLFWYIAGG